MGSCGGRLLIGDCRERLREIPDASIDSVVTDPPYELGFMGKRWDASGVAYDVDLWREVLRVLKPGGHLLAFGGTRTYHRMAVAIEDAGFEVRDSIHWLYGSGFPKSLDVSKAIDKAGGNRAEFTAFRDAVKAAMKRNKVSRKSLEGALGNYMLSHSLTAGSQPAVPNYRDYVIIRDHVGLGGDFDHLFAPEAKREVVGTKTSGIANKDEGPRHTIGASQAVEVDITAPATDAAKQWSGYGTALKPAHEPIVVARKPLVGTVAANVLEHGTGALNIDGCRVGSETLPAQVRGVSKIGTFEGADGNVTPERTGRWPHNLVLTHAAECEQVGTRSDKFSVVAGLKDYPQNSNFGARAQVEQESQTVEVPVWSCAEGCPVAELDGQSGVSKSPAKVTRGGEMFGGGDRARPLESVPCHNDTGGASRFFTVTEWDPIADVAPFRYIAKPSKRERNAGLDGLPERDVHRLGAGIGEGLDPKAPAVDTNFHPTVKPVALMRWLVRLVTPPGGTVLDPFLGSGTTAMAAVLEGFDWFGCEMTDDYVPIIEGRLQYAESLTTTALPKCTPTEQPTQLLLI